MITKAASELGYKGRHKFCLHACIGCGKERWVMLYRGKPSCLRCHSCENGRHLLGRKGSLHPCWRGGRFTNSEGYIYIRIYPENTLYPMADKNGYVFEHRIVMAQYLGRLLEPQETPHHRGTNYPMGSVEDKQDNRVDNLWLFPSNSGHAKYHRVLKKERIQ